MKWKVFGFNADGKITVTVKANSFDEALEKARKLYDSCMVGAQKI